jgi:glycosyltransferase involved in cell wall biosynthesis
VRVLLVAQWYPPIIGGEELHVRRLAIELARRGHEVVVATMAQDGLAREETYDGVTVVRLRASVQRIGSLFEDSARQSAAPIADPELVMQLEAVARRHRADVIHAHNWMVHAAVPLALAGRAKLVVSLHDFSLVCATKVLLRRGADCSGPGPVKCLDCAIAHYGLAKGPITAVANAVSSLVERRAVSAFLPVSRAVAIGNRLAGVPHRIIPNFVEDEPEGGQPDLDSYRSMLPEEPYVLFAGALGRLKGLPELLHAYRDLENGPPLVVIGYRMRETEEIITDLPANVHVLGQWPSRAMVAARERALVCVVPSVCQEACPTVIIEAMRSSVPVIGTALGGIPDLVEDGITGLLVPPGDPGALRDSLRTLVADPGLSARLGRAGRERSEQFTAASVIPRIEAVYREVVATGTLRSAR